MASAPPPNTIGEGRVGGGLTNMKICQNVVMTKIFFTFVELEASGGVIFITILLHFHYSISLETAKT